MDITFNARVAVWGLGRRPDSEKIVSIPVTKSWRPSVGRSVNVVLMPELCGEIDLRYFPDEVREKRSNGSLRLEDLLSAGTCSVLRVYVFAYRPYVGTRWMLRGKYDRNAIKPGYFFPRSGKVDVRPDGAPPPVDDIVPDIKS
jgi:hypothetical protein